MLTNNVAPALNNATAIKTLYDGLAFPPNSTQVGVKFESPASESIGVVANALTADTTPGGKFIIFLTDGQPDYCDDSNSLCAPDSVVYHLQKAYAAGVTTIVFGVQTTLFDLAPGALQSFANAGAGEATLPPVKTGGKATDFYDQCSGVAGWAADLTASGKTASARRDTLGTYSTTMGPTTPYTPSASNQSQLVTQLSAALSRGEELLVRSQRRRRQIDQGRYHQARVGHSQDSGDGDPARRHQRLERRSERAEYARA